MVTLPMNLGEP